MALASVDARSGPRLDEPLVEARGLLKRFGDLEAVRGIDLAVHRGEVFGFLGANGAGKSSTMRMIAGASAPTGGSLRVLGMDPGRHGSALRRRLGICPQADNLDNELSVAENLITYARYFGIPRKAARARATELLSFVQLDQRAKSTVDTLSGGMKRRLTIARCLVNDPDLVLLDEPTTGLDPQVRHMLWDRFFQLRQQGLTLILTTHYMEEAEQLCDRLAVLDGGRIVAEGSPQSLIERHVAREVVELRFATESPASFAEKLAGITDHVDVLSDRIMLYVPDGDSAAAEVYRRKLNPSRVVVRRSSLEDVFLRLTGATLSD